VKLRFEINSDVCQWMGESDFFLTLARPPLGGRATHGGAPIQHHGKLPVPHG